MKIRFAAVALIPLATIVLLRATVHAQPPTTSVWDGVYTVEQANRGKGMYAEQCASCHGSELTGGEMAPPLAGQTHGQVYPDGTRPARETSRTGPSAGCVHVRASAPACPSTASSRNRSHPPRGWQWPSRKATSSVSADAQPTLRATARPGLPCNTGRAPACRTEATESGSPTTSTGTRPSSSRIPGALRQPASGWPSWAVTTTVVLGTGQLLTALVAAATAEPPRPS